MFLRILFCINILLQVIQIYLLPFRRQFTVTLSLFYDIAATLCLYITIFWLLIITP